ncbi:unnamed protein product [Vitrella brassicaformis CCMP3155]|uniref:SET domain-containing protein n=1 Tax=Vitrella brassicaformis (strain CCMP3155) TaxID=1169540 RepID=A0A0G4F0H5_VITBC|nr:unnamed protein product [Vitrella brassicaformis CCMP3155]|eukprot:CEM05233.1 unnamed protein product [Vitrella brassicaformis CCMP3155]
MSSSAGGRRGSGRQPRSAPSPLDDTNPSSSPSAGLFCMPLGTRFADASPCDKSLPLSELSVPPEGIKASARGVDAPHLEQVESLLRSQGLSVASFEVACRASTATSASASQELLCRTVCRTLAGPDVWRLCGDGADPETAVGMGREPAREPVALPYWLVLGGSGPVRVSVLCLAVDDPFNSCPATWSAVTQQLRLPPWPTCQVQREVLRALIANGAKVNAGIEEGVCPLSVAHQCANVTATEVLLENGAAVRNEYDDAPLISSQDQGIMLSMGLALANFSPKAAAPSQPSPPYEAALLEVYRLLFEHDRALASGRLSGTTAMHMASQASPTLSSAFIRSYLDLLTAYGASSDATADDGTTPLVMAVSCGDAGLPVVKWLCERLRPGEINLNFRSGPGQGATALGQAAYRLTDQLCEQRAPPTKIERQKEIIRALLRHGASVDRLAADTPFRQRARSFVHEIQEEMQQRNSEREGNPGEGAKDEGGTGRAQRPASRNAGHSEPSEASLPTTAASTSRSSAALNEGARPSSSSTASTGAATSAPSAAAVVHSPADKWRATGNDLFKRDKHLDAYRAYLQGIRMERETLGELLVRRAQCLIGVEGYLDAFLDVTTVLRILPPLPSVDPGSKCATIQCTAVGLYKGLIEQLCAGPGRRRQGRRRAADVVLPSKEAIAALMKNAMAKLCSTERQMPGSPRQVADALAEGEMLQGVERYAEARDVLTAGLATADVETLVALLSNAAACLLKPELIKEGGPDAVGCAAAAFHLSSLQAPCEQLSDIQQKTLILLGHGLLSERLFDAADAVTKALGDNGLEGQMTTEANALQQRIHTHMANASGVYDWAAIYRHAKGNARNTPPGKSTTPIDVGEYVGPVAIQHAPNRQPCLIATENIQPGQLLIVQKAVIAVQAPTEGIQGRLLERLVSQRMLPQLVAACDGWHPRLLSQLCCLPLSKGQPSAMALTLDTCLGLTVEFPLLPRFMDSPAGEEFGQPVVQRGYWTTDRLRQLLDFNTRVVDDVIDTSLVPSVTVGLWPLPSQSSHAGAERNAIWYVVDGVMIVRAVRPIPTGSEVTVSYLSDTFISLASWRDMASRHQVPGPQYSSRATSVMEEVEQQLRRLSLTHAESALRELEQMLRRVRELNVDTPLITRMLHMRVSMLYANWRDEEGHTAMREVLEYSRQRRSFDVDDLGLMALHMSSIPSGEPERMEIADELKKSCEVLLGTSEASDILYSEEDPHARFRVGGMGVDVG